MGSKKRSKVYKLQMVDCETEEESERGRAQPWGGGDGPGDTSRRMVGAPCFLFLRSIYGSHQNLWSDMPVRLFGGYLFTGTDAHGWERRGRGWMGTRTLGSAVSG
jgi:hypothetical protein